jgi:hypothetical protein
MAHTLIDGRDTAGDGLTATPPPLDADTPAGALRYALCRLDALEHRVADLEEWLEEVASDLLDRTGS